MNTEESGDLPYQTGEYPEKVKFFGDAAGLLLDTYGRPGINDNGQPIDVSEWSDDGIATSYELSRFRPEAKVEPGVIHQFDLKVTESYPNGEKAVHVKSINPVTRANITRHLQMTTAQQAEIEERAENAPLLPNGEQAPPRPRKDDLQPEHEMELLLDVINHGLEILESPSPDTPVQG